MPEQETAGYCIYVDRQTDQGVTRNRCMHSGNLWQDKGAEAGQTHKPNHKHKVLGVMSAVTQRQTL